MTHFPAESSYEHLRENELEEALAQAQEVYWTLQDQLASAVVTIAALKNVIQAKRVA